MTLLQTQKIDNANAQGVCGGHAVHIDTHTNLKDASISMMYRKRVFWLVLLVFGNVFSGAGIAYFE
ncbi:hypothetical protein ACVP1L_003989 [Vibrio vulnificus]